METAVIKRHDLDCVFFVEKLDSVEVNTISEPEAFLELYLSYMVVRQIDHTCRLFMIATSRTNQMVKTPSTPPHIHVHLVRLHVM